METTTEKLIKNKSSFMHISWLFIKRSNFFYKNALLYKKKFD